MLGSKLIYVSKRGPSCLILSLQDYTVTPLSGLRCWHWKPRVIMMSTLPSLVVMQVVIMITCGTESDNKVRIMTTFGFRWMHFSYHSNPADTWRSNIVIVTSKDIATSFWRYNDVFITSCVHWEAISLLNSAFSTFQARAAPIHWSVRPQFVWSARWLLSNSLNILSTSRMARAPPKSQWMSLLPDSTPLSSLTIPGTHNTMAVCDVLGGYVGKIAQCQEKSLREQYEMGIRFVDIRCRLKQDTLPIHHGRKFQGTYFYEDVLKPTVDFLEQNENETILMLVQYELYNPVKGLFRYCDLIEDSLGDASRKNRVLRDVPKTLGEARGRIIIFHKNWPKKEPTLGTSLYDYFNSGLHDDWKEHDCPKRWDGAHNHLEQARSQDGCRPMLTYVSGHAENWLLSPLTRALGLGVVPDVQSMVNHLNGELREYLRRNQTCRRCLGVVLMDLAPEDLVASLIDRNFR